MRPIGFVSVLTFTVSMLACSSSSSGAADGSHVSCVKYVGSDPADVSSSCSCSADMNMVVTSGTYEAVDSCPAGSGVCCVQDDRTCFCASSGSCGSNPTLPGGCDAEIAATGAGATTKCSDAGYCSIDGDNCLCGSECVHYGAGEYMCGKTCVDDSDCTSEKNVVTGDAYTRCIPGNNGYDGFCG